MSKGWTGESSRHAMARMGIKTATLKSGIVVAGSKKQVDALLKLTKKVNRHVATNKERKKNPYLSSDSYVYEKKVVKPKITPMPKGTNVWDVEDPEGAGLNESQNNQIWQHLVDTGMAWSLQGWYGRTASAMIEAGIIHRKK